MSKLLIKEYPLMILPSLAVKIGLKEAIILQQIHYWINDYGHLINGKKWIYNSVAEWQKQFPFWKSKTTITTALNNLEKLELISTDNFNKLAFDKTKWYSINYDVVNSLENSLEDDKQVVNDLPKNDKRDANKCKTELTKNGRPIPETTQETTPDNNTTASNSEISNSSGKSDVNSNADQVNEFRKVQSAYENTIGNLSSFVIQDINYWIKDTSSELVIEAIKRADANNIRNWNYASGILKSWANSNVKTLEQVQANDVEHKNKKASKHSNKGNNNDINSEHFRPGDYDDMEERIKKGKLPF